LYECFWRQVMGIGKTKNTGIVPFIFGGTGLVV
jgi:hypothetical protein